ncbi:MAG: AzlD domain-containing protein [Paracoccus sp. (in: a-proteobacteria)]|nr:AzlD domain-containing protein [Paracoccus sp. (in: a-proteobacteria)]
MSDLTIWTVIAVTGIGTFLLRFSFLGAVGRHSLPPVVLRLLRYTPVAVLPALVAPLVVWPAATGENTDPARLIAAVATVAVGMLTRNVLAAILAGAATLGLMLYLV